MHSWLSTRPNGHHAWRTWLWPPQYAISSGIVTLSQSSGPLHLYIHIQEHSDTQKARRFTHTHIYNYLCPPTCAICFFPGISLPWMFLKYCFIFRPISLKWQKNILLLGVRWPSGLFSLHEFESDWLFLSRTDCHNHLVRKALPSPWESQHLLSFHCNRLMLYGLFNCLYCFGWFGIQRISSWVAGNMEQYLANGT